MTEFLAEIRLIFCALRERAVMSTLIRLRLLLCLAIPADLRSSDSRFGAKQVLNLPLRAIVFYQRCLVGLT